MTNPPLFPPSDRSDHGGGIDAAAKRFGGARRDWIDLSTGINPQPYPLGDIEPEAWTALPDHTARTRLETAARRFWHVPADAGVLAAPGASALIALMPLLAPAGRVRIATPTYNEHARAFAAAGWQLVKGAADAQIMVHPNNPDGRLWSAQEAKAALVVIDESFCDVTPKLSLIAAATRPGVVVLKSFGKFWGLAGLRLGFAIGDPALLDRLAALLGPWPVSGPALAVGRLALDDLGWAEITRSRLAVDAQRLDALCATRGAVPIGGTTLFRLYDVADAQDWQGRLAQHRIWTRIFPYSTRWLRLGLPGGATDWARLETAVSDLPPEAP
ncbi:MAG: threonine-phosphate decarboxylase CobD [Paracoccaceae bacterium]|nr:threonine-phosphate decarboxylase CobD [Paracoccaceae bacterium]